MHYRNGKEAKNGDKVIQLDESGNIVAVGILHDAQPGNDYCNGYIATLPNKQNYACLVDCLHFEDIAEILKKEGLEKRPEGK